MQFYDNLLSEPDFIDKLSEFGYSTEKIATEFDMIKQVVDSNNKQEKEKGEAIESTKERDAKLDELDEWISTYQMIAKMVFEDSKDNLIKLGFK